MLRKAVKRYGYALHNIKKEDQTEEICLEAVKHNGYLIQQCGIHTMKIVKAAIARSPGAVKHVRWEQVKNGEKAYEELKKARLRKIKKEVADMD